MSVRTTIHLDEEVYSILKTRTPPRKMSRFINQAIVEKLRALEREEFAAAMREGYIATCRERAALNEDWQVVDAAGWPE